MNQITITDLRTDAGDSAFLIDDGKTAILYDTGFGFTGAALAKKLKQHLGDRMLNYLFLSHSHYDHVLGSVAVLREYPDTTVVAGAYTAKTFERESALRKMREMDEKYARRCGDFAYTSTTDGLRVDTVVNENDIFRAGELRFRILELPGHTRCSIGFYLMSEKLLLAAETLGVFDGTDGIVPCFLVGVQSTLNSIDKVLQCDIRRVLIPHFGVLDEAKTAYFLCNIKQSAMDAAAFFAERIRAGMCDDAIIADYKQTYRKEYVAQAYPEDAVNLNTSLMIALVRREYGL